MKGLRKKDSSFIKKKEGFRGKSKYHFQEAMAKWTMLLRVAGNSQMNLSSSNKLLMDPVKWCIPRL